VRRLAFALALGALTLGTVGACGAQRATAPSAQPVAASTDIATADDALESADVSALTLSPVALLDQPVDAAHRAGDEAVYFVSRTGTIHRFVNNALSREPVLDISDLTEGGGERGLLGLAFSPDGSVAYINYTNRSGDTVVASLNVADNGTFERGSLRTIITIEQPFRNHNAGDLVVEPNGMLLVPMGDGGSADDPLRVSLDDSSLLGKVLRVDATTGATTIIAKGLRNPWRVDLFDDRLWLADVGQNKWEEVSVLESVSSRTANNVVDFGWSAYEANDRFNDDQTSTSHTPPMVAYEHGENGCSISGGAVAVSGALRGRYVFADYCSGRVWSTPADITSTTSSNSSFASLATLHFDAVDSPTAIVRAHNDLYVLSLSGNIWRING
jgi:hypothetical protein